MSLGFYVNMEQCIGCRTCQVACKDRLDIQVAGPRTRRVDTYECGTYPDVGMFHKVVSCNHCDDPACVKNCPTGAMYKAEDGTVQHDDSRCVVCRMCILSCPYGAPQHVEQTNSIAKCDSCKSLREAGMNPTCVDACPMRAIEFGEMDELKQKHGNDVTSDMPSLPSSSITHPNLLLKTGSAAKRDDYHAVVL